MLLILFPKVFVLILGLSFNIQSLEGLPTIRRLTLNYDEQWDYLRRQAVLSLRKNGTYRVTGSDKKVSWIFEYKIVDRKSTSGKIITGEKVSMV